jgi:hypothetical protein
MLVGMVGFNARIPNSSDAIIATGNGGALNIIARANEDGLIGGGFLSISALNDTGTAVFLGFRQGTFGGDPYRERRTATNRRRCGHGRGFSALGNSDINASGKIVFTGFLADGTEAIFSLSNGRFSLNDRGDIVFHFGLTDGRTGIAVAFRVNGENQ